MLTIESYWMGRDSRYRSEWTEIIQKNGIETVRRVNLLLAEAEKEGIIRNEVVSGWRPKGLNDSTANASKTSKHLTAEAVDIKDEDRELAQWCLNNQNLMCKYELWAEDPRYSPTWTHLQTIPPLSNKRIYIPSLKPPLAPPLDGQKPLPERIKL